MLEKNTLFNMKDHEYHAIDIMSYHQLKDFALSPAHWKANRDSKIQSKALNFGSAAHALILQPNEAEKRIKIKPKLDLRKTADKETLDIFLSSLDKSSIVIDQEENESLLKMKEKILNRTEFLSTIDCSTIEQACVVDVDLSDLINIDESVIVPFKFKPDIITKDGIIVDYKTTQCASLSAFSNEIKSRKYHAQLAFYSYLFSVATKEPLKDYALLIAQEKEEPYEPNFFIIDDERLSSGFDFIKYCLYNYYKFLKANKEFYGYESGFKLANFSTMDY